MSLRSFLPELLLAFAMAALFLMNATTFDIDPYSELFHIESAKEMVAAARFWTPLFNEHDYLIRAPFWTWIVFVFYKLLGVSLWAARLPAAICALLGVGLVYMVTMALCQSRFAAFFAAAVLGSTWGYFHLGSLSTADILTTDLYLGFFWAFLQWHASATRRHVIPLEMNLFSAGMGTLLGILVLAKGTFGLIPLLLIAATYLLMNQSLPVLARLNLRLFLLPLVLLPLPWFMWVSVKTGNAFFISDYFIVQPFQRMTGSGPWENLQPDFLFYLKRLPFDLMPYLFLLLGFLGALPAQRRLGQSQAWTLWLAVWFLVGLVFCSASVFHEPSLILPFYPPVAILAGWYLSVAMGLENDSTYNRLLTGHTLGLMGLAVTVTVIVFQVLPSNYVSGFWKLPGMPTVTALEILGETIELPEAFPVWKLWLIPGPFILLIGGLCLYVFHTSKRMIATGFTLVGTCTLFLLFVKLAYLPVVHRPVPQAFAQALNHQARERDRIVLYSTHPDIKRVLFHLDSRHLPNVRFVKSPGELSKALAYEDGRVYGVIRENAFFNDLPSGDRMLLRVNRFNWKWDMTTLPELSKLLVVRLPLFEKMKSNLMYFHSLPAESRTFLAEPPMLAPMATEPEL